MKSDLYNLIHSLSKNEKRYFKIEATKIKKNKCNYLIVYDVLGRQAQYNENVLQRVLQEEAPQTLKRLSAVKSYLYCFILKTLCQYHEEKSSEIHFSNLMQRVEILFMKGLYRQTSKVLKQAKKMAHKNQLYAQLLLVFHWEYKLVFLEEKFYKSHSQINNIHQQQEFALDQLNQRLAYDKISTETYSYIYTEGPPRTRLEKENFQNITEIKKSLLPPKSRYTQDIFHFVQSTNFYFLGKMNQALIHAKARVLIYEQHPQLIIDDTLSYLKIIYNYIETILSFEQPDFDEVLYYIDKVNALDKQKKILLDGRVNKIRFFLIYSHSIRVFMEQGNFEKATQLGLQLKKVLPKYVQLDKNENEFFVYLNFSFCFFVERDFDLAVFWIQKVLNDTSNTVRYDLLSYARILNLMIQYELENYLLLPSLIEAARRFIEENNQLQVPEAQLLSMFRKLSNKARKDSAVIKIFKKTHQNLIQFMDSQDFLYKHLSQYWVLEWIESKLQKVSYSSVIIKKIQINANKNT